MILFVSARPIYVHGLMLNSFLTWQTYNMEKSIELEQKAVGTGGKSEGITGGSCLQSKNDNFSFAFTWLVSVEFCCITWLYAELFQTNHCWVWINSSSSAFQYPPNFSNFIPGMKTLARILFYTVICQIMQQARESLELWYGTLAIIYSTNASCLITHISIMVSQIFYIMLETVHTSLNRNSPIWKSVFAPKQTGENKERRKNKKTHPLGIGFRHEGAQGDEVLIHLFPAVSFYSNVRHPLCFSFFLVLAYPWFSPPLLPPLNRQILPPLDNVWPARVALLEWRVFQNTILVSRRHYTL